MLTSGRSRGSMLFVAASPGGTSLMHTLKSHKRSCCAGAHYMGPPQAAGGPHPGLVCRTTGGQAAALRPPAKGAKGAMGAKGAKSSIVKQQHRQHALTPAALNSLHVRQFCFVQGPRQSEANTIREASTTQKTPKPCPKPINR